MAMQPSATADQRFRILQLLCWSFLFSLAIYVIVARTLAGGAAALQGLPPFLPWILVGVAVLAVFSAPCVAGLILRAAETRQDVEARLDAYQQSVIVAFALRESAGVMGIVLALLTGNWLWAAGFSGGAALAMATGWPSRSTFDRFANPTAPPPIA